MGMFLKVIGRLLPFGKKGTPDASKSQALMDDAIDHMVNGRKHEAITALRTYLEGDPYNVKALNDLGACLSDTGAEAEAYAAFERAYALDDSFPPVVVNHAHMLVNQLRIDEALQLLRNAKLSHPHFSHVDAVYANLQLKLGEVARARHFQKRAWLANFDNLRLANGHLFDGAYDDIDEALLAAEHQFWAATSKPFEPVGADASFPARNRPTTGRRIRIGYWSPDFRDHAVRFFFRPLLEGHDPTRFETFLYHDIPQEDLQTQRMQAACSQFHRVSGMSDTDLYALIRSHELDVLIELAGHSSNNRIVLMQQRFATVQISGLGYPPTTGLQTIDAKLVDRHIATADSALYYTETPLVLPTSFWCFDPCEPVAEPAKPPVLANGHITFGCAGNIAKITDRILGCWSRILERMPSSRLLIRSISFEDGAAVQAMQRRITAAGIAPERYALLKPAAGTAYFESYKEIDVVLDTYPFNGGTTTCFAAYMGVPVVTWAGASLISRMGLSVMTNIGAPQLAVTDPDAYVQAAVALASDVEFLEDFRRTARQRFKRTALGDGKAFASDLEQACLDLLQRQDALPRTPHAVPVLPADEIMRRAFIVTRYGQSEARRRILGHCLAHYPDHGSAHILVAQDIATEQSDRAAADYLWSKLDRFSTADSIAALINISRYQLLAGSMAEVQRALTRLAQLSITDPADLLQVRLYESFVGGRHAIDRHLTDPRNTGRHINIVIPCDDGTRFDDMRQQIGSACARPAGWTIDFEQCSERLRIEAYRESLQRPGADIVIFIQKNIALHNPAFMTEIATTLESADMVGFFGATRWTRIDWRMDDFSQRPGSFFTASAERSEQVEIQWSGMERRPVAAGLQVLSGGLLAVKADRLRAVGFDEDLVRAELLLEEAWSHAAAKAGLRLAVHQDLGIVLEQTAEFDTTYYADARIHCGKMLGVDPFEIQRDDHMMLSVPAIGLQDALRTMRVFLEEPR